MQEKIKEYIETTGSGKIPDGYKIYKKEIVPNNFSVLTLGELMEFQNGINAEKERFGRGIKIIGVSEVLKDEPIFFENIKGEIEISEEQAWNYSVAYGDIVFQRSSENIEDAGTANVYLDKERKATFGGFVIRGKRIEDYNPIVLNEVLKMRYVRKQSMKFAAGMQHINIGQDSLRKIWIMMPNEVQQKCVEKIAITYFNEKRLLEKLILFKKENKKWLAQMLLTGKKRLRGFENKWNGIKMSSVLTERKEYAQKGMEYEHVSLTKDGIISKGIRYDREHLVKNEEKQYKVTRIDDICYNPANLKFGVICRNSYGDAIFSPIYVTFEIKENYDADFVQQYVSRNDFINAVRKFEEGTVYERMAVKAEDFLKFEVIFPELDEQKAIARILKMADKEIELLEKKLGMIREEKKIMMKLLLKGIVQVDEV